MKLLLTALTILSTLACFAQTGAPLKGDTTGITISSGKELHAKLLKETKPGGKLDFFTPIKGHEYDGIQIKPGLFDSRIDIALYLWGKTNKDLGVASLNEAYAIFAEFKGRELSVREKGCIKDGYEKRFEQ